MAADAYKTMCNLLGTDESILTVDNEHNMYHTGTKVAANTTVKFKSTTLKAYLKEIKMSMESLSTKMGYTYNYVGACVKTGKMNEDAYTKMCEILNVGKSKFAKYEYAKKPRLPKAEKPTIEKTKTNYSQLVMTDENGKSHVMLLIDKDEFEELNGQLNDLLTLMDSAFSQISMLQLKLNKLTTK